MNALYLSCRSTDPESSSVIFLLSESTFWKGIYGGVGFGELRVRLFRYLYIVVVFFIQARILFGTKMRRTVSYKVMLLLSALLPLIWIGRINNEFLLKGSLIIFVSYSILLTIQWHHSSLKHRLLIATVVLLGAGNIVGDWINRRLWDIDMNPHAVFRNKQTQWGGTLDHPEAYEYLNFFGKNSFPKIFYPQAGDSACILPSYNRADTENRYPPLLY